MSVLPVSKDYINICHSNFIERMLYMLPNWIYVSKPVSYSVTDDLPSQPVSNNCEITEPYKHQVALNLNP